MHASDECPSFQGMNPSIQRLPCILLAPKDFCTLAFYGSEISEASGRQPHSVPDIDTTTRYCT
jgi:hypothetical protein